MQEASRKRICAKKALIIYMRANRALWDYGEPDYKNKLLKSQLYADIHASLKEEFDSETLSELNCDSADGVKSLWKNLRSTYTMIKKRLTKPGGDITPKPWMWQELMSFLDEVDANPIIDYRRANPEGEVCTQRC